MRTSFRLFKHAVLRTRAAISPLPCRGILGWAEEDSSGRARELPRGSSGDIEWLRVGSIAVQTQQLVWIQRSLHSWWWEHFMEHEAVSLVHPCCFLLLLFLLPEPHTQTPQGWWFLYLLDASGSARQGKAHDRIRIGDKGGGPSSMWGCEEWVGGLTTAHWSTSTRVDGWLSSQVSIEIQRESEGTNGGDLVMFRTACRVGNLYSAVLYRCRRVTHPPTVICTVNRMYSGRGRVLCHRCDSISFIVLSSVSYSVR